MKRQIKISFILIYLSLVFALVILSQNFTKSYETSIYTSSPVGFWFFFILSFGLITGLIFKLVCIDKTTPGIFHILTFMFTCGVFFCLNLLRGYFLFGRGDSISHYVNIINLTHSGLTENSLYPAIYILSALFNVVTSVDVRNILLLFPAMFAMLLMICIYLITQNIFQNKIISVISLILSATPNFYSLYFIPNEQANVFLALLLVLITKFVSDTQRNSLKYLLILILLYPLIVNYHLIPSFVAIIIVSSYSVFALSTIIIKKSSPISVTTPRKFTGLLLLFVTIYLSSLKDKEVFSGTARNMYNFYIYGGHSKFETLVDTANMGMNYGFSILEYYVKNYFTITIYMLLLLGFLLYFLQIEKSHMRPSLYMTASSHLTTIFVIGVVMMLLFAVNLNFGPLRLLYYIVLLTIPFASYMVYHIFISNRFDQISNRLKQCILLTGLCIIMIIGYSTAYPSPWDFSINEQIPLTEVNGAQWLFSSKDTNIEMISHTFAPFRYALLFMSETELFERTDFKVSEVMRPPPHFGYAENQSLGASYNADKYLILTNLDKLLYSIFPQLQKGSDLYPALDNEDYDQLNYDINLIECYENGGFNVYYVGI